MVVASVSAVAFPINIGIRFTMGSSSGIQHQDCFDAKSSFWLWLVLASFRKSR
jgi:hypothetical protein